MCTNTFEIHWNSIPLSPDLIALRGYCCRKCDNVETKGDCRLLVVGEIDANATPCSTSSRIVMNLNQNRIADARQCLVMLEREARCVDWNARRGTQAVQCRFFSNALVWTQCCCRFTLNISFGLWFALVCGEQEIRLRLHTIVRFDTTRCIVTIYCAVRWTRKRCHATRSTALLFPLLIIATIATADTAAVAAAVAIIILCTVYVPFISYVFACNGRWQCEQERRNDSVIYMCIFS